VKAFLEIEPNNHQVNLLDVSLSMTIRVQSQLSVLIFFLQEYIETEMRKEFKKDAAIAGGALLVFGGLLGVGFALAKK
jgi:fission 1 protein